MEARPERRHLGPLVGLAAVSLLACSPGGGSMPPGVDSGTMMTGADSNFEISPPSIDWLDAGQPLIAPPTLTPCPDGWREVVPTEAEEGEPVTCEPYPEGGAEACADGWAHFAGEPGCTPVGAPCPVGDYPEGLPDGPLLYVLSSAAPGGDGSRGAPLSSIADAMAMASPGTIVALGKGEYNESVRLAIGVTLWGACAAETHLTTPSPGAIVQVFAADTQLKNVRLGPADRPGLVAFGASASVSVDGVLIDAVGPKGIIASDGARIEGHTLWISDTRADGAGYNGQGIYAGAGGSVELTRVVLSGNRQSAISATEEGTTITLSDLVVRDTLGRPSSAMYGWGLEVTGGATVQISRALFERNHDVALFAADPGTSVTLSDLVVRDTRAQAADGGNGTGLVVVEGATVGVTRALFTENRDIAVFADDMGTSVTLSDLFIRDTQGRDNDGNDGTGLQLQGGASVDVARALITRSRDVAVFAEGATTQLTLTDVAVRDTLGRERDGEDGIGLAVIAGAAVEVTRGLFADNRDFGIIVAGIGTMATLADILVENTQGQLNNGRFGRGLEVQDGVVATVTRAAFAHNHELGIVATGEGTSLILSDLVIRDTQGRQSDARLGTGLQAQHGAFVDVTRALLTGNHHFGVGAVHAGTMVRLSDILIGATAEQPCASTTCADKAFGIGLGSFISAEVITERFSVTDSELCGVMLAEDGAFDLREGEVSGSPVGVCLQVDDYAVPRLTEGVRYTDNGSNIEATTLPVPAPIDTGGQGR